MRIPYDLLTHLANSLINDTIFEIVKRLIEIQHVTESHLFELRQQAEAEHEKEVQEWITKITDPEELQHILALMKIKHKKKMKETDQKLILHLDAKVQDQQKNRACPVSMSPTIQRKSKSKCISLILYCG